MNNTQLYVCNADALILKALFELGGEKFKKEMISKENWTVLEAFKQLSEQVDELVEQTYEDLEERGLPKDHFGL